MGSFWRISNPCWRRALNRREFLAAFADSRCFSHELGTLRALTSNSAAAALRRRAGARGTRPRRVPRARRPPWKSKRDGAPRARGKLPCRRLHWRLAGPARTGVSPDVAPALFGGGDRRGGSREWQATLGDVRAARFYSLPGDVIRYDIRSVESGRLEHRVGWKQTWSDGRITRFEPVDETLTYSDKPWFRDVTGYAFAR